MFGHANCGWYGYSYGDNVNTVYSSPITTIKVNKEMPGIERLIEEFYEKEYEEYLLQNPIRSKPV